MLAIKINDPAMEKELAAMAKKQHVSRQVIARAMIAKQLEDRADYTAAMKVKRTPGEARPIEELWRSLGLDN